MFQGLNIIISDEKVPCAKSHWDNIIKLDNMCFKAKSTSTHNREMKLTKMKAELQKHTQSANRERDAYYPQNEAVKRSKDLKEKKSNASDVLTF